jgi:hypothetical protein
LTEQNDIPREVGATMTEQIEGKIPFTDLTQVSSVPTLIDCSPATN